MDGDLAGRAERQRRIVVALREVLADIAEGIAQTEDTVADTLEQLAAQHGDPDGVRRKRAEKARQYAAFERNQATRFRSALVLSRRTRAQRLWPSLVEGVPDVDPVAAARARPVAALREEVDAWEDASRSTDLDRDL
jgi:hypothetical protein